MNGNGRGFGGFGVGANRGYLGESGPGQGASAAESVGITNPAEVWEQERRKREQELGRDVINAAETALTRKGWNAQVSFSDGSGEAKSTAEAAGDGTAANAARGGQNEQATENLRNQYREMLTARYGEGNFSQQTLENLVAEAMKNQQSGAELPDPIAQEEQARQELAQEQAQVTEDPEIKEILRDKGAWKRYDELTAEIEGIAKEIAAFRRRYMMDDYQKRDLAEARAAMNEAIRKRNLLVDYIEANDIVESEGEAEAGEESTGGQNSNSERAADLDGPSTETQRELDQAAVERVAQLLGDEGIAQRYQEMLQSEAQAAAEVAGDNTETSAEAARERLVSEVHEKVKQRPGILNKLKRSTIKAVLTLAVTITSLTALAGRTAEGSATDLNESVVAYESDLKVTPEGMARAKAEAAFNTPMNFFKAQRAKEAAEAAETAGLTEEEMGNLEETREVGINGSLSYYAPDYANFQNKSGKFNFGTSRDEFYGDTEGALASWAELGRNQPEAQAAYFAHLAQTEEGRKIWKECGIAFDSTGDVFEDARRIDDVISNAANGAEVQRKIDAKMAELLGSEQTKSHVEFYEEYGREKTSYMFEIRSRGADNYDPSDLELSYSTVQRHGQKQMRVGVYTQDGEYVCTIDLNMECGFQVNVELDNEQLVQMVPAEQVAPVINGVPIVQNPEQPGNPPEVVPDPGSNPEKEPDNEPEKEKDPTGTPEEVPPEDETPEGEENPPEVTPTPTPGENPPEEVKEKDAENLDRIADNTLRDDPNIGQEYNEQTVQDGEITQQPEVVPDLLVDMTEQEKINQIESILQEQQNRADQAVQQQQQAEQIVGQAQQQVDQLVEQQLADTGEAAEVGAVETGGAETGGANQ